MPSRSKTLSDRPPDNGTGGAHRTVSPTSLPPDYTPLLAVVTACAPIVAVTLYLGGVSLRELLLSHAVLMIAGVCFSTVGLAASTLLNRTFSALAAAYLLVIPLGLILVLRYQANMDLAISEGRELPASFLLSVLRYGTIISIIAIVVNDVITVNRIII